MASTRVIAFYIVSSPFSNHIPMEPSNAQPKLWKVSQGSRSTLAHTASPPGPISLRPPGSDAVLKTTWPLTMVSHTFPVIHQCAAGFWDREGAGELQHPGVHLPGKQAAPFSGSREPRYVAARVLAPLTVAIFSISLGE